MQQDNRTQLGIHELPYDQLSDPYFLYTVIYPDMYKNYYWSQNFSPDYYILQAKAGFIAVTDSQDDEELLLPEIQYTYAILDFEDLHISKKVKKLINKKNLKINISYELDEVSKNINQTHKNCWLTDRYLEMLKNTKDLDQNFEVISVSIKDDNKLVAGEIGYVIGTVYTSLSGFSLKDANYKNYGTAQLVLLAQHLEKSGFSFWNLGQPYMDYKLALGAKIYKRNDFLKRWFKDTVSN